jgi:DNA-binding CsgD family transcriptional regulator
MAATALPEGFAVGRRWTVLHRYQRGGRLYVVARDDGRDAQLPHRLSRREREVVTLAIDGRTNKEIACDLGLANSTVRVLLMRACAKIGARSRADLLATAANR